MNGLHIPVRGKTSLYFRHCTSVFFYESFVSRNQKFNERGRCNTRSMGKMVLLQPKYIKKFKAEKEKYQDHEKNNHKYMKGIKLLNKNMYVL